MSLRVSLLAHHHRGSFPLHVDVMLAAHVDRDAIDLSAGEAPGHLARIVGSDAGAAVAADAEALPRNHELAGLRLDRALAYLRVSVPEREESRRYTGRVLAALVERSGKDQLLANRNVFGRVELLLCHADEVVDVVQPVVLHVERVTPERRAVREEHALRALGGDVDGRSDHKGSVANVDCM